jgi:uncharacterized delta-60 repeat protein
MAKRPLYQLLSSLFLLSTTTSLLAAPPPMRVEAIFKQPDGNVMIAGKASSTDLPRKIVVARMTPTGQWDWGFGMMGSVEYPSFQAFENFHATSMTQYPDGKVLVAGRLDDKFALIRLDSFGNPDFSFGTGEPGMALLPFTDGFQANALYLQSDGGIIGFGSYQPPFGGGRQAAAVRYFFNGQIDWAFANQGSGVRTFPSIYGYETAFRALVPTANGVVVAGERREASSGRRKVIVAGFLADGSVDNSFGFNGWSQYEINMFGDESAESIRFDQLSGNYLIAGANGHMHNGPQNWLNAFAFNTMGQQQFWGPPGPEGNVPMPNLWEGNATAVVTEPLAENNDVLYGGTVIEMATGRSHFALWRAPSQGWSPTMWMPRASPVDADDDVMATAFATPDGQQIIAVGTRETPQGDIAVRMRYFADTGEFDTVMSEEPDNVPNPFSFEPFSVPYDPATYAYSAQVRISGINTQTEITAANGQFSLNCEGFNWTAGPEWISNGQKVCVRVLSATTPSTTTTVTLNVGGNDGICTRHADPHEAHQSGHAERNVHVSRRHGFRRRRFVRMQPGWRGVRGMPAERHRVPEPLSRFAYLPGARFERMGHGRHTGLVHVERCRSAADDDRQPARELHQCHERDRCIQFQRSGRDVRVSAEWFGLRALHEPEDVHGSHGRRLHVQRACEERDGHGPHAGNDVVDHRSDAARHGDLGRSR